MHLFDRAAYASRWRDHHPAEKILLTTGMLAICLFLPPWPACAAVWSIMTGSALLSARIPLRVYLQALLPPLSFLAIGGASLLVSLRLDPTAGVQVCFDREGLPIAVAVVARSMAALSCLLLLELTTPIPDLILFARRAGMPRAILEVSLIVYNMLFSACESARTMTTAQRARLGHTTLRHAYRSTALLAAGLLGRVLDRARRMEIGLAARGFQGELRVLDDSGPLPWASLSAILVLQLVLVATCLFGAIL